MPWALKRYQHTSQSHFVTFCCYHRRLLFTDDVSRRILENALERVRRTFCLRVYGYVVMPDHVHLLLSEPQSEIQEGAPFKPVFGLSGEVSQYHTLADALKSLKQGVARRLIGGADHFWQKRYYDFNVRGPPVYLGGPKSDGGPYNAAFVVWASEKPQAKPGLEWAPPR